MAIEVYRRALEVADPRHYALPEYHGELATVFSQLNLNEEARRHFEEALDISRRHDGNEDTLGVAIAGYFLGEHLLKMKLPRDALSAIGPLLITSHHIESLLPNGRG